MTTPSNPKPPLETGRWARFCVLIATGFHISYIPVRLADRVDAVPIAGDLLRRLGARSGANWTGAGHAGTLLGLAALALVPAEGLGSIAALAAAVLGASWVSHVAERTLGSHDDPRIVIDEVVGYWVAVAWLPRSAAVLAGGFVLFRILDSVKLPPYRWLERLPGGLGIVMDDVGAGAAANLLLRAGRWMLGA